MKIRKSKKKNSQRETFRLRSTTLTRLGSETTSYKAFGSVLFSLRCLRNSTSITKLLFSLRASSGTLIKS